MLHHPALTPGILEDVLLAGYPQARVEGGEGEAVVTRLPGERVFSGAVGQVLHLDAAELLDRRAEGLGHLLGALAPEGGEYGHGAQQQRHQR